MLSLEETRRFLEEEELNEEWLFEDSDSEVELDDNMDEINECLLYLSDVNASYYDYIAEQTISFNQYEREALIHEDYGMMSEALGDFKTRVSNAIRTLIDKIKTRVPEMINWIKEKISSLIAYIGDKASAVVKFIKGKKDSNVVKDNGTAEDIQEKIESVQEEASEDKDAAEWNKEVLQSSSFKNLWKTVKGKGSSSVDAIMTNLKNLPKMFEDLKGRILKMAKKSETTVKEAEANTAQEVQKKSGIFGRIFGVIRSTFSRFTTFLSGIFTGVRAFFKGKKGASETADA